MFLSAVSVLVVAQLSSEIPEGLMNNPVYIYIYMCVCVCVCWYLQESRNIHEKSKIFLRYSDRSGGY